MKDKKSPENLKHEMHGPGIDSSQISKLEDSPEEIAKHFRMSEIIFGKEPFKACLMAGKVDFCYVRE